jgi:cob(I)alamin adenosyltransferase
MKYEFYSISDRKKVMAEVTDKVNASTPKRKSFILKGVTEAGKKLTAMVSEEVFNSIKL